MRNKSEKVDKRRKFNLDYGINKKVYVDVIKDIL